MSQDKLQVGSVIAGRYELRRVLGKGGMGSVWAAWHRGLKTEVALKFIDAPHGNQGELASRFATEAEAVVRIKSQHVVTILDHGFDETLRMPFLAMELLHGENLLDRIEREQRLTLFHTVDILQQALRGLAKAHAAGVIHRDLKPDNIFLCEDDELLVKLIDFGVARMNLPSEDSLRRTRTGVLIGTPLYMSPEQARGNKSVDHRSDLYSMGVVAYHCLAGRPPFLSSGFGDLIMMIVSEQPRPLNSFAVNTPLSIQRWLERSLAKTPGARFQSAKEMSQALIVAYEEASGVQPLPPRSPDVTAGFASLSASRGTELLRNSSPDLPTTRISASELLKRAPISSGEIAIAAEVTPSAPLPSAPPSASLRAAPPVASRPPAVAAASSPPGAVAAATSEKEALRARRTVPLSPAREKDDPIDELTALMPRTRALLQQPPGASPYDTPVSENEPMPIVGLYPPMREGLASPETPSDGRRSRSDGPPAAELLVTPARGQLPRWAAWVGVLAGMPALALGGWLLVRHPGDPTMPAGSGNGADQAPRKIALNLRATPPEAIFFLDDERLDNPCALIRMTDTAPHALRAEAPGYTTKTRVLSFDEDIALTVDLDRGSPTSDPSGGARPDASGGRPDGKDPKKKRDPARPDPPVRLDPKSPWKK